MTVSSSKESVLSNEAPKPIGPYSQGIRAASLVFASGQAGIDPATGELVAGGVEAETRQALTNIQKVLEAGGSGMQYVVKTTVFLVDMADFPRMNGVYAGFFPGMPPARSTVAVAALPKAAHVEIEAVAILPDQDGA